MGKPNTRCATCGHDVGVARIECRCPRCEARGNAIPQQLDRRAGGRGAGGGGPVVKHPKLLAAGRDHFSAWMLLFPVAIYIGAWGVMEALDKKKNP
jgi:hypothetical protein